MATYIINTNFRHWKKGDVLERYEYKRLPDELKPKCTLVEEKVTATAPNEISEIVGKVVKAKQQVVVE